MSTISESLGGTHEFRHKDKTYHVSLVTQSVKSNWEKRLFARAKEAASAMRDLMDKEDYAEHLKRLNDDYIEGRYAFESSRSQAALQTENGAILLMSLLFGCDEVEIWQIATEEQEELTAIMQVVLRESFPALEQKANAKN